MRPPASCLLLALVLFPSALFAQKVVKLPASTVVVVRTANALDSDKLKAGQTVILDVAVDVSIKGSVLIKAKTPAVGIVEDAESAGIVGQAGKLTVSVQSTTAVDGTTVALTGNFYSKGESKTGESVAVGVILCPLALLCKGEEGGIPAGAQARALTIGEYEITVSE